MLPTSIVGDSDGIGIILCGGNDEKGETDRRWREEVAAQDLRADENNACLSIVERACVRPLRGRASD